MLGEGPASNGAAGDLAVRGALLVDRIETPKLSGLYERSAKSNLSPLITWRGGCPANGHVRFGGRRRKPTPARCTASRLRPDTSSWIREAANCCFRSSPPEKNAPSLPAPPTPLLRMGQHLYQPPKAAAVVDPLTIHGPIIQTSTSTATDSKYETRKESPT
jgi:hypothetical protein